MDHNLQTLPAKSFRYAAGRSSMMTTTTISFTGKIISISIFLSQCVMLVDAQLGKRKRNERGATAGAGTATAAGEERVHLDELVGYGHEQNQTPFYIFTGLLALVVSLTTLFAMTQFSLASSKQRSNGPAKKSQKKREIRTDAVAVAVTEAEAEAEVEAEAEAEENGDKEKTDRLSVAESSGTANEEEDAGDEETEPFSVSDEVNGENDTNGDVAAADVPAQMATPIPSVIIDTIEENFPGALTGPSLAESVESALARNGYDKDKTLLATSLCCDEVNRMLEKDFASVYGDHFSMGGLAGFAFGGITSFGAMAHHIPDGGSCVIMYGPHVGVDSEGNVGTVNRRGRAKGGACCGSAKAAAGYVKNKSTEEIVEVEPPTKALDALTQRYLELKKSGTDETNRATEGPCYGSATIAAGCVKQVGPRERKELEAQTEALDAQQTFVGNMLLPFSRRLEEAEDPDVELPLALFDAQDEFMKAIVAKGCGNVEGDGKIALLGGIQINTPGDCPEFFLPLVFEIRNNKGELVADLIRLLESS